MPYKLSFKNIFKLKKKTNTDDTLWEDNENLWDNSSKKEETNQENSWNRNNETTEWNQEETPWDQEGEQVQEQNQEQDNWNQNDDEHQEEQNDQKKDNFIYILLLLILIIFIPIFILRIVILLFYLYIYKDLFEIKLISLRLNEEKHVEMEIDPFKLLFSQATVNTQFQNGILVKDTIDNLVKGEVTPNEIEKIRVCIIDNKLHTLDNRRLYCFQEAIRKGAEFRKIPITIVRKGGYYENNIEWKMKGSKLIVNNNDWTKVIITSSSRPGYYPEK
jgi:flagellar basal body-associated protein FliL